MLSWFLFGAQKVELVGGEGWLEHSAVAVAAVVAAGLAAAVAILNRRAQLKHDREMRNREHIRDVIDEAVIAANQTRNVAERFLISVTSVEDRREEDDHSTPEAKMKSMLEERESALTNLHAMRAARTRLEIRMDESDAVRRTYSAVVDAFVDFFQEIHKGIGANRPSGIRAGDEEREKDLEGAFDAFQASCRDWFNGSSRKPSSR